MRRVANFAGVQRWVKIERVRYVIIQRRNVGRRQVEHACRQEVHLPESAQIQMCSFLADVTRIKQNFSWQLFLESKTPRLLIGDVAADGFRRSDAGKADIVEGSQRIPRRRRYAAAGRIAEQARRIFQRIERRGVIDVQRSEPWRLHIEALISPRAGSGRSAAGGGKVDTIATAKDKRVRQLGG